PAFLFPSLLTLTTVLATLSGFLREVVIAYRFGTSATADGFAVVLFFVDVIFVIAGIAIATFGFVPILSQYLHANNQERGWAVLTSFSCWILLTAAVVSLIVIASPTPPVALVFPGFSSEQRDVLASLLRTTAPALWLASLVALISGTLQTVDR